MNEPLNQGEIGVQVELLAGTDVTGATCTVYLTSPSGTESTAPNPAPVGEKVYFLTEAATFTEVGTYQARLWAQWPADATYPNGRLFKSDPVRIKVKAG